MDYFKIFSLIPLTKFYTFKRRLLKFAAIQASENVRVVSNAKFYGVGEIIIGENSFIGHEVLIIAATSPVIIGANVDIGPRVSIINGSHKIGNNRRAGTGFSETIVIGDGSWIGAGSTIIAGVYVGERSVIGAGSIVIGNIESDVLAAGNPCKTVKKLI